MRIKLMTNKQFVEELSTIAAKEATHVNGTGREKNSCQISK
ncbi:hypothetical protein [Paenibacillus ehimensis]|nr:hypothetical protein [Paenibacillus ehimensis]